MTYFTIRYQADYDYNTDRNEHGNFYSIYGALVQQASFEKFKRNFIWSLCSLYIITSLIQHDVLVKLDYFNSIVIQDTWLKVEQEFICLEDFSLLSGLYFIQLNSQRDAGQAILTFADRAINYFILE